MNAVYLITFLLLAGCVHKPHYALINGHTPCVMGTCWGSNPAHCSCSAYKAGACFCADNRYFQP